MNSFSTAHRAYLARDFLDDLGGKADVGPPDRIVPQAASLAMMKIAGISRFWQDERAEAVSLRTLNEDMLAGFSAQRIPLIYLIRGGSRSIEVFWGTGSFGPDQGAVSPPPDKALPILDTGLRSSFPGVRLLPLAKEDFSVPLMADSHSPSGAFVTGTPTMKRGDEADLGQIERLIRGLYGSNWCYVVVAVPVDEPQVVSFHNSVLNEIRIVEDAQTSAAAANPVAVLYKQDLATLGKKSDLGRRLGMWHTAASFLCDDPAVFNRAKAVIKAVFGGEGSRPDPVRIVDCHHLAPWLGQLAQITVPPPAAPGTIRYPFKYLSLLTSRELSVLTRLPCQEMPGYFVRDSARFDIASHTKPGLKALEVGEVTHHGTMMGYPYRQAIRDLDKHGLIAGATGTGKTNTVFHLLRQIHGAGISFMVIEPAKTEYRGLAATELGGQLQIFTLADENTSPFRLNPFEILPGVSVQTHIDHLKSVFNASFVMYAPMPYVLETCIHEIYRDRGWDLVTGNNVRGQHHNAHPTLTDLYRKVDQVVDRLGYEAKITMDVKAALKTRIGSLRIGGKGLMLDTAKSIPMTSLLEKSTVLELEAVGDDDEKAFLIGLLLIFLYEHYSAQGIPQDAGLRHVTVIEEAHRLLKNVPPVLDTEQANMKGKAVETFCNILSEIRAYGEGFLVAEQIPSKLASDIIKNTGLKIMHRIVAEEDRSLLGSSMNLDRQQGRRVSSLAVGEAVVYGQADDSPVLVAVPYRKFEGWDIGKSDQQRLIRKAMADFSRQMGNDLVHFVSCPRFCNERCNYGTEVGDIVEASEFQEIWSRYVVSAMIHQAALKTELPSVLQAINKYRRDTGSRPGFVWCALIQAAETHFETIGRNYGWGFQPQEDLTGEFLSQLSSHLPGDCRGQSLSSGAGGGKEGNRIELQNMYGQLCRVDHYPYEGCRTVCNDNLCLFRYSLQPLLADDRLKRNFAGALSSFQGDEMWRKLAGVCAAALRRSITNEAPDDHKRRAAVCFAIQVAESMLSLDLYARKKIVLSVARLFERSEYLNSASDATE